jgi:hypothetical protein
MRQALILLTAAIAAFVCGVAVSNSSTLQWIESHLVDYIGLKDSGEIVSVDLPPPPTGGGNTQGVKAPPSPSGRDVQATVSSPAQAQASKAGPTYHARLASTPGAGHREDSVCIVQGSVSPKGIGTRDKQEPAEEQVLVSGVEPKSAVGHDVGKSAAMAASGASTVDTGLSGALAGSDRFGQPERSPARGECGGNKPVNSSAPLPAPLDPGVSSTVLSALSSPLIVASGEGKSRTVVHGGRATSKEPPSAAGIDASAPINAHGAHAGALKEATAEWLIIRHRMCALGVSRYTIDGAPDGRVIFRCLVPLAGRQAIAQQFEAEGDNELEAAQGVTRRITLWQATRPVRGP